MSENNDNHRVADARRLAALHRTGLLDSDAEESFDRLTRLATRLLHAPVALVSLVDADRQFFKSQVGLDEPWASERMTALSHSFCQHVVNTEAAFVVPDARVEPLVRDNMAIPDLGVIAYAGVPISAPDGEVLGSFCVIDDQPRKWSDGDVDVIRDLAESVNTEIRLRADLQERQRTEAALRESEARFRNLVESANDIIYGTDKFGHFTYVNPVAVETMLYPENELIGMRFTQLVRADVRGETEMFYLKQFGERIESTYHEFPAVTRTGQVVWIGQNVRLVMEDGRVLGAQAVARDITQRREMDRLKDELVSVVSHELRTPLTSLRGSLGLLASGRLAPEQASRMIEIAVGNTDRLIRLINDFLDLERIKSGRSTLEIETTGLKPVIESAVASVESQAVARGIRVEYDVEDVAVEIDADRMVQVVVNLLSNAIKFSDDGSTVSVRATRDMRELRIDIVDQGRGIPRAEQELIFQPFHQVDASDAREKGGSGLGLPICRSIVEQHGGKISVTSELKGGTTFHVCIPQPDI